MEDGSAIAWSRKIICLPWHNLVEVQVKPWKRLLESFTAISGILSYIISEKNRKLWKFLEPTIKNFRKLAAAVQKMGKIIRSNIVWLAYQQSKIFKKFKANGKFVNVVNQVLFGYIWYSKLHTFSFHENKDWAFWNLYSFCITLVARHINKLRKLNWHLK